MVAHQTSAAEALGSNPTTPTMILMRCRIIVKKCKNLREEKETFPLRQKRSIIKTKKFSSNTLTFSLVGKFWAKFK